MCALYVCACTNSTHTFPLLIIDTTVSLCAIVLYWVTKKEFGSAPRRSRRNNTPWRPARDTRDSCHKVAGLCCEAFKCSTLVAGSSIPASVLFMDSSTITDPHPGSLVPGSTYLGTSSGDQAELVEEYGSRNQPRDPET